MSAIKLENVTRAFGEKQVLKGISLDISEGEIFGLLGPSGAGKTTIINILTGQLSCGGRAEIFGTDCGRIGRKVYREIGAVLDNCGLYERLTCMDNMKLFAGIHNVPFGQIGGILEKVGLTGSEKIKAGKMSKGMKQRLQLARAILHQPKLLFLDEPTSGLDPSTAAEIHTLMQELQKNGTTIFLTTHNMDEAYRMCDRIALLNEGNIAECGNPAEICRKHCSVSEFNIITSDEEKLSIPNIPESAGQIAELIRSGKIKAIHSAEPDLGTVFLKLTGKELAQ
ncbi:MAG: ABC transporter ATP-binding protein [Firmicutes bacterium]|nr:ABC transporter ATP-binding protein [Bacillota bacterium]